MQDHLSVSDPLGSDSNLMDLGDLSAQLAPTDILKTPERPQLSFSPHTFKEDETFGTLNLRIAPNEDCLDYSLSDLQDERPPPTTKSHPPTNQPRNDALSANASFNFDLTLHSATT